MPMKTNILLALSEKSFAFLWLGEIATQLASNAFYFLLIFIVYQHTHSNTAVSGIVITFTIPAILFGSIAGAYVDHWDKKKVLIVTNVVRALCLILLAFSIKNLILLYLITLIFAIMTQFFIPAENPMVPLVVKEKHLLSANALFGMGIYGSIVVAYLLAGPLLIFLKPIKTLLFLSVLLILGAVFIGFVKTRIAIPVKENIALPKPNIFKDIKQALSFMSQTRTVSRSLFALGLSQMLILIIVTIAPGYANQILGINIESFLLLFAPPAALGMVFGAAFLVNKLHNYSKQRLITAGILISGISLMALPYGSKVTSRAFVHTLNFYLPSFLQIDIVNIMIVLVFILGIANSLIFAPANTIIHEHTSDNFRGKIYGFLNTLVGLLSLLPILIVGGLADLVGVGVVLLVLGTGLLVLGGTLAFLDRK